MLDQTHVQFLLSCVNRVTPLCAAKLQMCTETLFLASIRCNLKGNHNLKNILRKPIEVIVFKLTYRTIDIPPG